MLNNVIINPLLTFVCNALEKATIDDIIEIVEHFYEVNEVNSAKELLWSCADIDIIGRNIRRKESQKAAEPSVQWKASSDIVQATHLCQAQRPEVTLAIEDQRPQANEPARLSRWPSDAQPL